MPYSWCVVAVTRILYSVTVHIQCQASIYTLSLCGGHSWRVRLAKQETLTPPGDLVSPLVCRVRECPPWCSIVGATVTCISSFVFYMFKMNILIYMYFDIKKYNLVVNSDYMFLTVVNCSVPEN